MQNFRRSLKYLWPYRGRIAVAIICVLFIATLWSGGLGLVLPGSKIFLSEEGLHGWAYTVTAGDHLRAQIIEQKPNQPIGGKELARILNVAKANTLPSGQPNSLLSSQWIVGVDGEVLDGRSVARRLAAAQEGESVTLLVQNQGQIQPLTVTMAPLSLPGRVMQRVAQIIPEPQNLKETFPLFVGLLIVCLLVTILRGIFTFIQEYLVGTAIRLGIMDLRCENYNKVLHLPSTFFSEKGVSDATSRFIQDTNELGAGQSTLLGKTLVEPAKAVGSLCLALWLSWELTLMVLLAGPPAFWLIRRLGKKMHKAARRALESWSIMLSVLAETLQGIRVVKAYTMEGSERKRFFRVNRSLVKQQIKKELLDAATGPSIEALGICAGIVAAGVAGYMVFHGNMDRDKFLTWMVALFAMFDPVRKLAKVTMKFHEADAAAARIFELQDQPEEPFVVGAPALGRHSKNIEFRNVCFQYPGAAVQSVKNVSLDIRAGQTVAIVGPNGSGKTTLVSLLPRLLDLQSGQILIDGQDIRKVSVRSLRRQIGLVTQDTVIFHATIGENISYGLRRPHIETVLAASRRAFVDEFVKELPAGYDTMVGEHGATLSGGQKQRISIARAILRDPSILIFDEAMSQVDSDSEHRIHEAMQEFVKGRTTLMIAHRFATVLSADRIVVMADGGMVDSGTHNELLNRCELYHHLYRTQFLASAEQ